jgi:hypothetical protein
MHGLMNVKYLQELTTSRVIYERVESHRMRSTAVAFFDSELLIITQILQYSITLVECRQY